MELSPFVASADSSGQPEIFRIPVSRRLFVLEDIDAASQLVLDRKYQKPASAPKKAAATTPKNREVLHVRSEMLQSERRQVRQRSRQ